jgi:hypothetical protein
MKAPAVVGVLIAILLIAGLPGLAGLTPGRANEPWGVTTYEFAYAAEVGNFGTAAATNVTAQVALLRDFEPFQAVDEMAILTPGASIEEDPLGNRFAVYRIGELGPGASLALAFRARVQIFGIDFSVDARSFARTVPPEAQFVSPETFVESTDTRIQNVSRSIRANSSGLANFAYAAYTWTTRHLTYETQPQERGAVWALRTGRGMCYEYADLYISLLRAEGVASKRVNGWGERFVAGEVHRAEEIAHAWVLLETSDHGWLPVDPTFGDASLYENFLKINDMHVILTEGVNRHLYRATYDRTTGVNLQVDYTVQVLSMLVENLSPARVLVFVGFVSVPILLTAAIVWQVVRERRRRVFED